MIRAYMSKEEGRLLALENLKRARAKLSAAQAKLEREIAQGDAARAKLSAAQVKLECMAAQEALINELRAPPSDLLFYTASYLLLCGRGELAPSMEHARANGRPFPKKSKALDSMLSDMIDLGWGTLSPAGRLSLTPLGLEELEALEALSRQGDQRF